MITLEKNFILINEENELAELELHSAIITGDKIKAIKFLEKNNSITDKTDWQGNTPLHLAALNNHPEIISALINSSASTIIRNSEGKTALQIAQQLDHEKCIELLLENESILSNKTSTQSKEVNPHEQAKELVKRLEELVNDSISKKVSKKEFVKIIYTMMSTKFNLDKINFDDPKLLETMNKNFELIKILSIEQNLIKKHHKILGIVRKTIAAICEFCMKNLQKDHTSEIYFISKAESLIEEAIVRAKTIQSAKLNNLLQAQTKNTEITKLKLDLHAENKSDGFNELKTKDRHDGNNSTACLSNLKIIKEKILCTLSNNKTYFLDSVKVIPLSIVSKSEAQKIFDLSSKRLEFEKIINKAKLLLSAEILSTGDLKTLDHLMRPGKAEDIHIINFIPTTATYETHWIDITEQAFITGAVIHNFNYNGFKDNYSSISRNDLIYNGIAMVNKLLDDQIHPDKIILQGHGSGTEIAIEVVKQFLITSDIELTNFSYSSNNSLQNKNNSFIKKTKKELSKIAIFDSKLASIFERISPRRLHTSNNKKTYSVSDKKRIKSNLDDCPNAFIEVRNFIEKEVSGLRLAPHIKHKAACDWQLKDIETISGIPYFQLLNYFISSSQKLFAEFPELKNPSISKKRVVHIHNDMSLANVMRSKLEKQDSSCVC